MRAVQSLDPKAHSPLHWAALNNGIYVAEYLIEKGATIDVRFAAVTQL